MLPAEELNLSPADCTGECIYRDDSVCLIWIEGLARLFYCSNQGAGAVGRSQGESLLAALDGLTLRSVQRLCLHVNSAGANFREPMEGLFYLNALLERLWRHRSQGVHLRALVSNGVYGGMAMALSSVAHEVVLGPLATMGLLGHRAKAATPETSQPQAIMTPLPGFQPPQLEIVRLPQ